MPDRRVAKRALPIAAAALVKGCAMQPSAQKVGLDRIDHIIVTTSILKFITLRFGLEPLPGTRANAGDLTAAFAF